jgi:starch phosphorylase
VLNCSIRDGWWDEMSNGANGWDIPSFDDDGVDDAERDRREATATFELLEREIVPLYHERGDDGLPHRWIDRMKENWATLGWNVIAARMVGEYTTDLYETAARASDEGTRDGAAVARDLAAWRRRVEAAWPGVSVTVDAVASELGDGLAGDTRSIAATIDAGTLDDDDLAVQLVHGPIGPDGHLVVSRCEYVPMRREDPTGRHVTEFVPAGAGRWGATVRALPTHPALPSLAETGLVTDG